MRTDRVLASLLAAAGCAEPVPPVADDTSAAPTTEAPEVAPPDVAVAPQDPLAGETLRCDVDPTDARIAWEVDGQPVDLPGAVVPGELVDGYQQWTCEAVRPGGVGAAASVEVEEACTALDTRVPLVAPYEPRLDLSRRSGTVEAWFFLDVPAEIEAGRGARFTVLAHQDEKVRDGEGTDFLVRLDGTEILEVITGPADDGCGAVRVAAPPARGWHHVAVSWSAESQHKRVFVDGAEVASCVSPRARFAYGPVGIGAALDDEGEVLDRFVGFVDEVRLSDVVRYREDFEPERYPRPDRHAVWLLHFDDPAALGRAEASPTARDSGRHRLHVPLPGDVTLSAARSTCDR